MPTPIHMMKLHEEIQIKTHGLHTVIYILRVPGGWIYEIPEEGEQSAVFVPYHEEFSNVLSTLQSHIAPVTPSPQQENSPQGAS